MSRTPKGNYKTPQKGSRHNPFKMQPPRAQIIRRQLVAALREYRQIIRAMRDPSFELHDEEFSIINESIARLSLLGVRLDPFLVALVDVLRHQLIGTDADSDFDNGDELLDLEDSDEDGSQNSYGIYL